MKKAVIVFALCVFAAGAAAAQASKGGTMYVSVKSAPLKSSTGLAAATRGALDYGAPVTVLQVNGNWAEVRSVSNSAISGWTALANLSAKRVVAGNSGVTSAKEVALAGKGFGQTTENAAGADSKRNYSDVDKTEAQTVSEKELHDFLVKGRLSLGDGQ